MPETSVKAVAQDVLGQFSNFVAGKYELVEPAKTRFLSLCDLADMMDEEFGSDDISIEVEPTGLSGTICFDTDEVTFEYGQSHPFFQYIRCADLVRFSKSEDSMLRIQFIVKDLWVKK